MVERSPYLCLIRCGWVPAIWSWDPETGLITHVEGTDAFTDWHEADEASRFLRIDGETTA